MDELCYVSSLFELVSIELRTSYLYQISFIMSFIHHLIFPFDHMLAYAVLNHHRRESLRRCFKDSSLLSNSHNTSIIMKAFPIDCINMSRNYFKWWFHVRVVIVECCIYISKLVDCIRHHNEECEWWLPIIHHVRLARCVVRCCFHRLFDWLFDWMIVLIFVSMPLIFLSSSSLLMTDRSVARPLGSPIAPVAPPAKQTTLCPAFTATRKLIRMRRLPTWRESAVGSKPA